MIKLLLSFLVLLSPGTIIIYIMYFKDALVGLVVTENEINFLYFKDLLRPTVHTK